MDDKENTIVIGDYEILCIQTGRWFENAYVVRHIKSASVLLLDPGGEADQIIEAIKKKQGQPALIVLTHAHHDHVGAVKQLCNKYKLPFYIHPDEIKLLKRVPLYAATFEKRIMEVPTNYSLLDREVLKWGGEPISWLHTPGHTKGGVCYMLPGITFTGDTLLNKQIGRTDLPGAKPELLNSSINKLLNILLESTLLLPGHGNPWLASEARDWWEQNEMDPKEYRAEGSST